MKALLRASLFALFLLGTGAALATNVQSTPSFGILPYPGSCPNCTTTRPTGN